MTVQLSLSASQRAARRADILDKREDLATQVTQLTKTTERTMAKLATERKALEAPKRLTGLKVSWVQDGEEVTIGPLGDVSPAEFLRAVSAIPRSVRAKLDGDRLRRLTEIRDEMSRMPREYRRKLTALETSIYHCDAQLAALEEY